MTARDVVPQPTAPRGFLRRRRSDEPYPHHKAAPLEAEVEASVGLLGVEPIEVAPVEVPFETPPVGLAALGFADVELSVIEVAPEAEVPAPAPAVPSPLDEAVTDLLSHIAAEASEESPEQVPEESPEAPSVAPLPEDDLWLLHAGLEPAPCAECQQRADADEMFAAQATLLHAALRQTQELEVALAEQQDRHREETARLHADNELLRNALVTLQSEALARRASTGTVPVQRTEQARSVHAVQPAPSEPVEAPLVLPPRHHLDGSRPGRRRSDRPAGPA